MDGQRLRSDQPHTWRVTTDGPVGADAGKKASGADAGKNKGLQRERNSYRLRKMS